ncbi:MAG: hypothetical protein ABUK08_07740 [Candidatus Humimicrobiaceae bacterium]
MEENNNTKEDCKPRGKKYKDKGGSGVLGGAYFVAFVAAAVYFIQGAGTFWMGLLGFLKAVVWPGYLVYYLLEFLNI